MKIKFKIGKSTSESGSFTPTDQDFNAIFGEFFGTKPMKPQEARQGKDVGYDLDISFGEVLYGVQKNIKVPCSEICPICGGSGAHPGTDPVRCTECDGVGTQRKERAAFFGVITDVATCSNCQGKGQVLASPCPTCQGKTRIEKTHFLTMDITPDMVSGCEIRFPGQGEPGYNGGPPGDLIVTVNIATSPLFTRTGRDVSIRLPINAAFAKKGGQLRVPRVEQGRFSLLTLPPNTRHGTAFPITTSDTYTFTAIIEIYQPYNLFALPEIRKRLQAIKDALNGNDLEIRTS